MVHFAQNWHAYRRFKLTNPTLYPAYVRGFAIWLPIVCSRSRNRCGEVVQFCHLQFLGHLGHLTDELHSTTIHEGSMGSTWMVTSRQEFNSHPLSRKYQNKSGTSIRSSSSCILGS